MTAHTLQRDGQRLYYETYGSGPPLILIHSYLCCSRLWSHEIKTLSASCTVIAVDLRGHGRSGPSEPHDLYDLVDDVIAVLDPCAMDPCSALFDVGFDGTVSNLCLRGYISNYSATAQGLPNGAVCVCTDAFQQTFRPGPGGQSE